MTQRYFEKFPTFQYSNTLIRDITRRCVLPTQLRTNFSAFYPYDLTFDQRSDVLAFNYYNDTDADWLIYLTNGIIDPYYGWHLSDDNFAQSIIDKYGNLIDPQQRIKYWVTNWDTDDHNATTSYFNALPVPQQKYFAPVWGPNNQVLFYHRRQEDWFMNTNQIWTINVANNLVFSIGDLVSSNTTLGAIEGTGEVMSIKNDGSSLLVKDITNTFNVGSSLQNFMNTAVSSVISNVSITQINIPLSEAVYWQPVTFFNFEQDANEKNKSLLLLDNQFLQDASSALQQNLNNG